MDNALKFKVATALLEKYCLFRGRWVEMMDPTKTKYPIQTIKQRFTDGDIMNHLDGNYTVCVFAGQHATKFISIDVDLGDKEIVRKVIDTMEDMGIPRELIYVSYSGRKGYHVDIFFDMFIYNNVAEKFYWAMIERSGLNPRKVEFRPTYLQAIKLPLGIHQATGNRCWFVNRETLEPIESFEYIFEIETIPQAYMNELVNNIVNEYMRALYDEIKKLSAGSVHGVVPNYKSLIVNEIGTRHGLQKKVAAMARMDGNEYDDIVKIQMDWYAKQDKSKIGSTEGEVRVDAEMLAAWAVKNVAIKAREVKPPNNGRAIRIAKNVLPYILRAPTKSTRMVLFLLIMFSDMYSEVKIAYKTMARYIGISELSVRNAIKWLAKEQFIKVEHTVCRQNRVATLRGSNRYIFPGEKKFRTPNQRDLLMDYVDIRETIADGKLPDVYYKVLGMMCRPEYLAKFLTKPELEECKRRIANGAEDQDDDAGGDEGISGVCRQQGDSAGL